MILGVVGPLSHENDKDLRVLRNSDAISSWIDYSCAIRRSRLRQQYMRSPEVLRQLTLSCQVLLLPFLYDQVLSSEYDL